MSEPGSFWKKCSACKKPIPFGAIHYVCSVSTCNRKRTALQFCTVSCWEVHLPVARHREAWAEERVAPSAEEAARAEALPAQAAQTARGPRAGGSAQAGDRSGAASAPAQREPRRILVGSSSPGAGPAPGRSTPPREVLVIASRLKDYIRAVSGMNTSDRVLEPLSEILREVADRSIERARADGRRTVLDRDVPKR